MLTFHVGSWLKSEKCQIFKNIFSFWITTLNNFDVHPDIYSIKWFASNLVDFTESYCAFLQTGRNKNSQVTFPSIKELKSICVIHTKFFWTLACSLISSMNPFSSLSCFWGYVTLLIILHHRHMQWLAVTRINWLFGNYKKYMEYRPILFFAFRYL